MEFLVPAFQSLCASGVLQRQAPDETCLERQIRRLRLRLDTDNVLPLDVVLESANIRLEELETEMRKRATPIEWVITAYRPATTDTRSSTLEPCPRAEPALRQPTGSDGPVRYLVGDAEDAVAFRVTVPAEPPQFGPPPERVPLKWATAVAASTPSPPPSLKPKAPAQPATRVAARKIHGTASTTAPKSVKSRSLVAKKAASIGRRRADL
ncbi:hypothetical protein SPRG_09781 [Saprolegnia parasitica CBS 223.65]|uniref:Uncharacterized protein n=1 Tax=Saprolegnia parasitica (strain CBS 223.65) TaxID=695850 RepID=A0A067CE03_SAPPC|nr:hypothetical protein SPRG_09781 [Saprolegnia parasitica CBS 223.65]KDO25052.1 hypothetical protein SPRG_09781 [Saprolegnia parasitica CBS 223.65]|eukprot:XP_012204320.1 hypothetical protein SPRG_09781 [Saprolegnia parasitica CBS 223.65]